MSEKLQPGLLRFAAIYQSGISELNRIQASKPSRDQYWKLIKALDRRIKARFAAEVGPVAPRRLTRLAGSDAFYAGTNELSKDASKQPDNGREDPQAGLVIGLMEFAAEHRFHKPLQSIVEQHLSGDRASTGRFLRLEVDLQCVRYGDGLPPFKGNMDHRILMQTCLEFGFENVTADQQAEFFDLFCPCGVSSHDADDLRRLKGRILKIGRQARTEATPKFSGPNQRIV